MGVHGLWELLAPVGRRVSVETLAGKILAIDASIWLVQFLKAMRDDKGEMVRNAHLIGFFRRICKLLFLRTKPVFVFDGGTPALKRRTVIARRRQRENAQAKIRKTAEKLLLNHLKSMRLKELASNIENQRLMNDVKGKKVVSDQSEVSAKNEGDKSDAFRKHDQEKLDEMLAASIAAEEDDRLANVASTSNAIPSDEDDGIEEMIFPDNLEEVDDALLNALPPDLLVQMRKRSSARDSTHHEQADKGKKILSYHKDLRRISTENTQDMSKQNAQEKLDEMLAASIAAEEDGCFTNNASAPSAGVISDEEDSDGDEEMIVPEMQGDVDRAVLDSLPLSMRLDLFAQMKERQMAENRQKYQTVKKAPEKFSELQIQSYLKGVALRREINQVQKAASGSGVDGVQTSRIASEGNKEFIFSSSFTGDKEILLFKDRPNPKTTKHVSSESRHGLPSTSNKKCELGASKSKFNFDDGIETFLDEQGHVRVSRVRAMGMRMTRDLQRNLDLMREIEKNQTPASSYLCTTESLFKSVDDKRENEKLAEQGVDDNDETVQLDVNKEQGVGDNESSIQISFEDDEENKCLDDEIFARLVAETSVKCSSPIKGTSIVHISDSGSDCDWEEGIVDCFPKDQKAEAKSSHEEGSNADSEVEWEDGTPDNPEETFPCGSEYGKPDSIGSLEEDADLQEAIRRSLQEQRLHIAPSENVKEQTQGENNDRHTYVSASENTSVVRNTSFSNPRGKFCGVSDRLIKLNFNEGTHFSHIADSLEEQESNSVKSQGVANELSPIVQASDFELSKQGDTSPKREIIPELTQHLKSDETHSTTERQRDVSAESCQISASADSHVRGNPCPSDMSGRIGRVDKSQNAQAVTSDIVTEGTKLLSSFKTVSSNNFDMEQSVPDNQRGDFTEKLLEEAVEASDLEVIKSSLEEEMLKLDQEYIDLGNEQKKLERNADSVSSEMFTEIQELLQMFGLPYIIAPMEAEAQCAHLELANLVDGVVTDDSDVLLFGARSVYKNIFDDRKYVETYLMKDIEKELGLTREKLIHMALLLGSDYTEGISGIGIVNATEVLNAFPEEDGLKKFREWIESPDPSILGKADKRAGNVVEKRGSRVAEEVSSGDQNHREELKQYFMDTHRNVSKNWHIPHNFPSEAVASAYLTPQVDKSAEPFSWGKPEIFLLRRLCWEKFSWNGQKADELLIPVLNEYSKHEIQLRLEAFYSFNEKFAKIRSKRIKKAVKGITGGQPSEPIDEAATRNGRKRRATPSAENKERPSGEEEILGQNESSLIGKSRSAQSRKKRAKGQNIPSEANDSEPPSLGESHPSAKRACGGGGGTGRGRGRGRGGGRRTRLGKDASGSGIADETISSDDNDGLEVDVEAFDGLQQVRRSARSRKAVDYTLVGDSDDDNTSKSSLHASDREAASGLYGEIPQSTGNSSPVDGGFCADEGGQQEVGVASSEHDYYLRAGGGFCMAEEENMGPDLEELSAERNGEFDHGNDGVTQDMVSDEPARQHNCDPDNSTLNDNPRVVAVGALSAMPFLRRKRKKT